MHNISLSSRVISLSSVIECTVVGRLERHLAVTFALEI